MNKLAIAFLCVFGMGFVAVNAATISSEQYQPSGCNCGKGKGK